MSTLEQSTLRVSAFPPGAVLPSEMDLLLIELGKERERATALCRQYKSRNANLPIVTASSMEQASISAHMEKVGSVDHVILPAEPLDLESRLSAHVRWSRRARDLSPPLPPARPYVSLQDKICRYSIDQIPWPMLATDVHGKIVMFNRAARRWFGFSRNPESCVYRVGDLYANRQDAHRVMRALASSPHREPISMEVELKLPNGEKVPVALHAGAIRDEKGNITHTTGIFQDNSEKLSLQQRLEHTTRQLIDTEKRKNTYTQLRWLVHELNQPLTVALGTLEIVNAMTELDEPTQVKLDRIQEQLQRMADSVRKLATSVQHQAGTANAH